MNIFNQYQHNVPNLHNLTNSYGFAYIKNLIFFYKRKKNYYIIIDTKFLPDDSKKKKVFTRSNFLIRDPTMSFALVKKKKKQKDSFCLMLMDLNPCNFDIPLRWQEFIY
jgi:hypothetical protein